MKAFASRSDARVSRSFQKLLRDDGNPISASPVLKGRAKFKPTLRVEAHNQTFLRSVPLIGYKFPSTDPAPGRDLPGPFPTRPGSRPLLAEAQHRRRKA